MKTEGKDRLDMLFAAARLAEPEASPEVARAEMGFETRLLARIRADRAQPPWYAPLYAMSWRLVPLFMAVVVALGSWYYMAPDQSSDMRTVLVAEYDASMYQSALIGE
jgi:hypothetical protein